MEEQLETYQATSKDQAPPESWTDDQIRKYDFELDKIPKFHFENPEIDEFIKANKPVIIADSSIVKPAKDKWSLEYLKENLGTSGHAVFFSPTHTFKYFDDKKIKSATNPNGLEFEPPTRKEQLQMTDFLKKLEEWKEGDNRIYLQQSLTTNVGAKIVEDFLKFDWSYVNGKQKKHNWGPLTSNLLFVSMEGNVTPCHYDEQENFFAQIHGRKRCILFPPNQFQNLYPYPVYHPHDRQSMVDFDNPNHNKFPNFRNAKGFEAVINPGDVLYIPIYWWHHVESLMRGGPTITVNFWYKASPTSLEYPLKDHQKIAIMRNVEKMLLEVLQQPSEVGPLLRTMVQGRYTKD